VTSDTGTLHHAIKTRRARATPREAAERTAWRINALALRYEETDGLTVSGAELIEAVFGAEAHLSGCLAMLAADYRRRGDLERSKLYEDLAHAAHLDEHVASLLD
jgi:hypothetical protein